MLECRDIDGLMMDWLYQELARDQRGEFDAHVDSCARCAGELATFQRTREAVSALPEVEPPSSITAILMHEAARAAPARAVGAVAIEDDEPGGILGWLSRLFSPIVLHPAATAVATLVLVAGVAGSIYIRGDHQVTTHEAASAERAPATPEVTGDMMRMPDETAPAAAAPAGRAGYNADLAPLEQDTWKPGAIDSTLEGQEAGQGEAKLAEIDGKLQEIERRINRGDDNLRANKRARRGPPATANAVSGTDVLVDLDDGEGVLVSGKATEKSPARPTPKSRDANRNQPAQDPAPPPAPSTKSGGKSRQGESTYRAYKSEDQKDKAAAEESKKNDATLWAATAKQQLDEAARLKKCQAAAKIANDILDRNPEFYYQKVNGSVSVKTCSGFVAAERDRRVKSRGEKRAAKKKPRKGASAPAKAKAAPADEAAESND